MYERGLIGRAGREFSGHENPLRPAVGLQCELPLFLTDLHPLRHEQDAEDFLSRLQSIPDMLRLAGDRYVERLGGKLCPPIIVQDAAIEETGNFSNQSLADNPVLTAFRDKSEAIPGMAPGTKNALLADVRATLHENVVPAYRDLADRMTTARNSSVTDAGLWRVPGGPEWYAFLLRAATTTTLDADTIHELGLEETARLEQRMVDAARSMGADARSISDCHGMLDAEAPGPLPDTDENRATLMADMNRRIEAMRRACEELFHRLPSGPLEVKAMPRFAENHRNQSYQPPSLDGTRPGFMELSLGQLLRDPPFETPILVYHEIYPGHHLQIAHAGELEHLPRPAADHDLRRLHRGMGQVCRDDPLGPRHRHRPADEPRPNAS